MFQKKVIFVVQAPNPYYFDYCFPFNLWQSFEGMSVVRKDDQSPPGLKPSIYSLTKKIISTGMVGAIYLCRDHLGFSIKSFGAEHRSSREKIEQIILSHFFLGHLRFRFQYTIASFSDLDEAKHLSLRSG